MVVVVVLSGIPYRASATEIAQCLDQLFDTDDIGTFRVRTLPYNGKRQFALDFRSGFDAMTAQHLLHGKEYMLPDGTSHVLHAKVTKDNDLLPSRSPSPEPSNRRVKRPSLECDDWKAMSLVPRISDGEIYRVKAKLDAQYELLLKEKLVIETERKLLRAKRKLEKEYKMKRPYNGSNDDEGSRSRSKSPERKRSKRKTKSSSKNRKRSRSKEIRKSRSRPSCSKYTPSREPGPSNLVIRELDANSGCSKLQAQQETDARVNTASQEKNSSDTGKESLNSKKPDCMQPFLKQEPNPEKTNKGCVESMEVIQDTAEQQTRCFLVVP